MARAAKKDTDGEEGSTLGRLKRFGLERPEQVAFLLPERWEDLRAPRSNFSELPLDHMVLLKGRLDGAPSAEPGKKPRITFYLADEAGVSVGCTAFGDTRPLEATLKASSGDLLVYGKVAAFGGKYWLRTPQLVDPRWVGRLRPVYPGLHRVVSPQTVRGKLLPLLKSHGATAASWLVNEVVDVERTYRPLVVQWVADGLCLPPERQGDVAGRLLPATEALLRACHLPADPDRGMAAQAAMERIAALGVFRQALQNAPKAAAARFKYPTSVKARSQALPFKLSSDQVSAVTDIWRDMRSGTAMRRLLSGDVGSGKTAVYGLAAAAVIDAHGRVVIMLPSQALASQVHREMTTWWPDLAGRAHLVTGSSEADRAIAASGQLLIGTTALLSLKPREVSLCITDEQQRFSVGQREALVDQGCHLLEVSATCIPRSQALCRYGMLKVSRLRPHVVKEIVTRVLGSERRSTLMQGIRDTVRTGGKVLVVYPARESDAGKAEDLPSAAAALDKFERTFPGRVVMAHGGQTGHQNDQAIAAMRSGAADILVATSVVEVGMNIPNLRHVVVVHAERFGLVALHQLRGRAAREGGRGRCDLYLPRAVGPDSMERLQVMERCSDGFDLADEDLRLRGFGDLGRGADRQSGADETFLFGRGVRLEVMDSIIEAARRLEVGAGPEATA